MNGDLLGLYDLEQDDSYTAMALYFAKGSSSGVHALANQASVEAAKEAFEKDYSPLDWEDPPEDLTVENLGNWAWKRRINLTVIYSNQSQAVCCVAYFSHRTRAPFG